MEKELIIRKINQGERVSLQEGLFIWRNFSWQEVSELGHLVRQRLHHPERVSYTLFRVVNYSNFCTIECSFCSFMDEVGNGKGYTLSPEAIFKKIEDGLKKGANQVFLQGGVNPEIPMDYYLNLLREIKSRYGIHIRGFSPVELLLIQNKLDKPLKETLSILKQAGLDSVPGAGAEILSERMRAILAPKKATVSQWVEVMETCHQVGLNGSANIVIGSCETDQEILEHLDIIRNIQDKTHGFKSFVPWTFQPQTKKFPIRVVRHDEYLKLLGLCRIYLDNIINIETSLLVLGKDIGSLALRSGANDINSVVIEENVLKSFGLRSEKEAVAFIEKSGFKPFRRDFDLNEVPMFSVPDSLKKDVPNQTHTKNSNHGTYPGFARSF